MIHSEQKGGGGQFKLMTGDLIRLIETKHEHQAEQLEKLGGVAGVAAAIAVNIQEGLDSNNAADLQRREDTYGSNYVPPPRAKGLLELMWEAFQDLTIMVLTASGIISVILSVTVGDHPDTGWIEGACIIFAVFVVTFVTAINDYQKEKQFRSLNAVKEDEKIKVIRNGVPAEISKFSLCVGDIVRVDLGDIIPADGIVFDEKELKLDESAMTGESDLMVKGHENPFLLSGTKVMEGLGKMLVVCVGESSQAGIIKKLILGKAGTKEGEKAVGAPKPNAEAPTNAADDGPPKANGTVEQKEEYDDGETQSPLEAKLYRLTILIGKLGTTVAILVFLIMCLRFSIHKFVEKKVEWKSAYVSDYLQFFIVAITVLVVAIPEGLPLAVTIALAYSVKKMLLDNNLVRHLDACETMGSATTICSDKTGTLTTNRMAVMQVWIGGQEFSSATQAANEMSESTKDVFFNGICINSTAEILPPKVAGAQPEHTGNKTECALLQFVRDCGVDYPQVRANADVGHMLTFSSKKKRMSVVVRRSATTCRIYTKGATEVVLGLCNKMKRLDGSVANLDSNQKDIIGSSIIEKYASQGYRTLCLSYRDVECSAEEISKWSDDDVETDLTSIAIVGIEDPVRKEVPDAIKQCHRAGIVVRMVTGDNITTARSIAGKCGILTPGDNAIVIEGQEFRSRVLDGKGNIIQAEFDRIWPHLRVMARSSPKDKYTLVTGLMQSNVMPYGPQIVAVTGDGTNDAPALKKANVGFAMGISGTAVSKDASDIILMDDNFTSIVQAIKWGRNVYDSIAKFLQFQLTVNVVAIALAFLGAAILEQSPLSAVQMLWVNLIMDSFASLALATEQPTQALLERRPYPKTKPLLSKMMTKHILGQSMYQLIVLLVLTFVGEKLFDIPSGRYADLSDDAKQDPTQHMTIIFNTFVWMQLFNELNCRKIHNELNIFDGITGNRVYMYVTVFQVFAQVVIVQCTGRFFNCKPLDAGQWGVTILIGAGSLPVGFALRLLSAKRLPSWIAFCHEADAVKVSQSRVSNALQKGAAAQATLTN
ncbi:Calcium-translocating p-type atpase, pmca-type, partial [Globisporangium splendens]